MPNPATVLYPRVNQVTSTIVTAAMKVHSVFGAGWLESAYQACLFHELRKPGLKVLSQVGSPVIYDGEKPDLGYRVDPLEGGSGCGRNQVCRGHTSSSSLIAAFPACGSAARASVFS